jgi:hypothetical protein
MLPNPFQILLPVVDVLNPTPWTFPKNWMRWQIIETPFVEPIIILEFDSHSYRQAVE